MKLEISKPAWQEVLEAQEYYNLQQDELGDIFKNEIKKTLISIKKFPNLYPNITKHIKRCLLHKFSYSLFYTIENDTILILSIAHQHRKPRY